MGDGITHAKLEWFSESLTPKYDAAIERLKDEKNECRLPSLSRRRPTMTKKDSPHTQANLALLRELFFDYHDAVFDILIANDESVEEEHMMLMCLDADDALSELKAFLLFDMENPNVDEVDYEES